MTTLSVYKFETAEGAQQGLDLVEELSKQELIEVHDAAIVTWPDGKNRPKTKQLVSLIGAKALDGAFWGMLFGFIFFVPFFGLAVGAAMGALSGKFADYGINDQFIKSVQEKVTKGTSALFLLTSKAVMDKISDAAKDLEFELIYTNLSQEQETELRNSFA